MRCLGVVPQFHHGNCDGLVKKTNNLYLFVWVERSKPHVAIVGGVVYTVVDLVERAGVASSRGYFRKHVNRLGHCSNIALVHVNSALVLVVQLQAVQTNIVRTTVRCQNHHLENKPTRQYWGHTTPSKRVHGGPAHSKLASSSRRRRRASAASTVWIGSTNVAGIGSYGPARMCLGLGGRERHHLPVVEAGHPRGLPKKERRHHGPPVDAEPHALHPEPRALHAVVVVPDLHAGHLRAAAL
mmetsp:Transcript_50173/g.95853  ORF Transcript_50173/g.95853 Transcript_50173/m.95853 type:complete len:241 (-) Transcript_50173:971-1693(-)